MKEVDDAFGAGCVMRNAWRGVRFGGVRDRGVADESEGAPERTDARRLQGRALAALSCLAPKERMAFVLRELQGLDTLAVARAMRVTKVTVRRHASNARRKIRERLEGQFPDLFAPD